VDVDVIVTVGRSAIASKVSRGTDVDVGVTASAVGVAGVGVAGGGFVGGIPG